MKRELAEKYIKLSEQQTDKEKKDYYWKLAEGIDECYSLTERAVRLNDRHLIVRCMDMITKHGKLEDEEQMIYWIEKLKKSNIYYDETRNTKGI